MYSRVLLVPALTLTLALPSNALAAVAAVEDADDDEDDDEFAFTLVAAVFPLPEANITTLAGPPLAAPEAEGVVFAEHTPVMLPDDELPPGLPVEDRRYGGSDEGP